MNSTSSRCIVCCDPIPVTSGIEENGPTDCQHNFDTFCSYLNIPQNRLQEKDGGEREKDSKFLFSFCSDCNNSIHKLHTLHQQQKEIRNIVSNIANKIIKSASDEDDRKGGSKRKDNAIITRKETEVPFYYASDHRMIGPQQIIISQIICGRMAKNRQTLRESDSAVEDQRDDNLTSAETVAMEALSELAREKHENDEMTLPCPSNGTDAVESTVTCQSNGEYAQAGIVDPPDAIIEVTVTLDVHLGQGNNNKTKNVELVELKSDDDDDGDHSEVDDPDYGPPEKAKQRPTRRVTKRKRPTIMISDDDDESEDGPPTLVSVMTSELGVFQYGQWKFKELVKNKKYECLECGEITNRRPSLIRHIHSVHILKTDKKAPTSEPEVTVDDDGVFHFKEWKFVKTNFGKFMCGHCDFERMQKHMIVKHITLTHDTNPVKLKCDKCRNVWTNQERFNKHKCVQEAKGKLRKLIKTVDLGNGKYMYGEWPYEIVDGVGYQCQTCGAVKKTSTHINIHIRERHSDPHKFICDICGFAANRQDVMLEHRTTHTKVSRNCSCDVCGKICETPLVLKFHKVTHASAHNCGTCHKSFRLPYMLYTHLEQKGHKPASPLPSTKSSRPQPRKSTPSKVEKHKRTKIGN